MAYTKSKRLERGDGNIKSETKKRSRQDRTFTKYPARPGEEQYEWEEPRVVADTSIRRSSSNCEIRENSEESERRGKNESDKASIRRGKAQPELGGATNGTSSRVDSTTNRVDRLRLLGNGVVPQTAERALRILTERIK